MVNLNPFQRLETEAACNTAVREGASGFVALAIAHALSLLVTFGEGPQSATLLGQDPAIISAALLAGGLFAGFGFFRLRRKRELAFAWILLIWSALGVAYPLTYALYGWASQAPLTVFATAMGLLALRGAVRLERLAQTEAR